MDRASAASRVKGWTRERFGDVTVMVTELESAGPAPLQTVVAFWTARHEHFHFKVLKALEDVREEDLPPASERDALAVAGDVDCACARR